MFFTKNTEVIEHLELIFPVFLVIMFLEPIQICLSSIIRVIKGALVLKVYILCFYMVGIGLGALLAFRYQLDLVGIWLGWLTALVLSIIFFSKVLYSATW
jgi:Na+-driven multidrug efflux pump